MAAPRYSLHAGTFLISRSQAGNVAQPERLVLKLAARQHGVVNRAQLLKLGFTDDQIATRIARGLMSVRHRGVYRVGPVESPLGTLMAACLACGPTAVVSGRSACELWNLLRPNEVVAPPVITVVNVSRSHSGIEVHRVRALPRQHVTRLQGVPVTTPLRSLLDLAARAAPRELERAVAEAYAQGLVTERRLRNFVAANAAARGASTLRELLREQPALTRSEAERRLLARIRSAQLPAPRVNARIAGLEVDLHWPAARLVVEVDGHRFHGSRVSFENDRRRDATLLAHGYRVMRITWRQLVNESDATLVRLAQALVRS